MKLFVQTNIIAGIEIPPNILTQRVHSWYPYKAFIESWSLEVPFSLQTQPQDYRILFKDGTTSLGFHWGDDSFLGKAQAYAEARELEDTRQKEIDPSFIDPTSFQVITCNDQEHPTQFLPNIENYSLGSDPLTVHVPSQG